MRSAVVILRPLMKYRMTYTSSCTFITQCLIGLTLLLPFSGFAQTSLNQGDIAIIGVNANANCPQFGFPTGADIVHIVFLVDFESGSNFKVTDNAYQRLAANPGQWGNNEGMTRLTYNGPTTIPAGTVVTFRWPNGYEALEPAAYTDWSFTAVDGSNTLFLNVAVSGDQLYIMQDPTWDNGTPSNHDATYTGEVLFGYNNKSVWLDFADSNNDSGLHPDVDPCYYYNTAFAVEAYSSYTGPSDPTTRENWMVRITDQDHWTDWGSCAAYQYPIDFMELTDFEFEGLPDEVCAEDDPVDLGTTHSGVEGSWSGSGVSGNQFDPSGLSGVITLEFTPDNDCLPEELYDIEVIDGLEPEFDIQDEYCEGDSADVLPNTSLNDISGTWSPSVISTTASGTYVFTPDSGQCADEFVLDVVVNTTDEAEFSIGDVYCEGDDPDDLPSISDNGVEGSWSPAVISTDESGEYVFTPDPGQCAENYTLEVTIEVNIVPQFDIENQYCEGDDPDDLPGVSTNGVSGNWFPDEISTSASGEYEFTPDAGQCSEVYLLVVTVDLMIQPVFSIGDFYCIGDDPEDLPSVSDNGIEGSWSPSVISTNESGEYVFTPNPGQCAESYTLEVTIEEVSDVEFDLLDEYCEGDDPVDLPSVSDNGIEGSWSPAVISTDESGEYVFTPNPGQCAEDYTLEVTIEEISDVEFNLLDEYCEGDDPADLPLISDNGIEGSWSPSVISTDESAEYVFTPDPGQCAEPYQLDVVIHETVVPEFDLANTYCEGQPTDELESVSDNGIEGVWTPGEISSTASGLYEFVPDSGQCAEIFTLDVEIFDNPVAEADNTGPYCEEETIELNGGGGLDYEWSGPNNFSSTDQNTIIPNASTLNGGIYTLIIMDSNGCSDTTETEVVVNELPSASGGSNSPVCEGDDIQLNASGGDEYNWSGPNNFSSVDQNPVITGASQLQSGTYEVEVSNDEGCSVTIEVDVEVLELPELVITEINCDSTLSTYLVEFTTEADQVDISSGVLSNLGGGDFLVTEVEVGEDLVIDLVDNNTSCASEITIESPDCDCPFIGPPTSGGDLEICEGADFPLLTATTGPDLEINWYDQPSGGILLEENNDSYLPSSAGTYYAEAVDPMTDCTSTQRTAITLTVLENPSTELISVECAPDLESYDVVIETDGDEVTANAGTISLISAGVYEIGEIPVDTDLEIEIVDSSTGCITEFSLDAPDCDCPSIDPPVSDGNVEICEGDPIPFLSVTVPSGYLANWYDSPSGGILLAEKVLNFEPQESGFYYASTVDPDSDCESAVRTEIIFVMNSLPVYSVLEQECSADGEFYAILLDSDATEMLSSLGVVIDLGGGEFQVLDIPIENDVVVTLINQFTECEQEDTVPYTANCAALGCEDLPPPEVVGENEFEICENEEMPVFEVETEAGLAVNWYDSEEGGDPLLENSHIFEPLESGNYYAEAVDTVENCISDERTLFSLLVHDLPELLAIAFDCDEETDSYSVDLLTGADRVLSPLGIAIPGGDSTWQISGIQNDSALVLFLINPDLIGGCTDTLILDAPNCDCPELEAPLLTESYSLCDGDEDFPELMVEVESGLTVNWYDQPSGGELLQSNSSVYQPENSGPFYAETVDTTNACVSGNRTLVEIEIIPLPMVEFVTSDCDEDQDFYSAVFTTDGNPANFWFLAGGSGMVVPQPDGTIIVTDVPIGSNVTLIVDNTATGCRTEILILSPDCGCPELDPIPDVEACTFYVLPPISGTDLDGSEAYYGEAGGEGVSYSAGDTVFQSGTYYVYIAEGHCELEESFEILILDPPEWDPIPDLTSCRFLSVADIGFSGSGIVPDQVVIFEESGATGFSYTWPDTLFESGIYYARMELGECFDEVSFEVELVDAPSFVLDSVVCSDDLLSYSVYFTSDAFDLNASQGVISVLDAESFVVTNVPVGNSLVLELIDEGEFCSETIEIEAPICECPQVENTFEPLEVFYCEGELIPLVEIDTEEGFSLNWYDAPEGEIAIAENQTSFQPPSDGSYYFEVVLEGTDCGSDERTLVEIREHPLPELEELEVICSGEDFVEVVFLTSAEEVEVTGGDFSLSGDTLRIFGLETGSTVMIVLENEHCSQVFDWTLEADLCECDPIVNIQLGHPACPEVENGYIEIFESIEPSLPFAVELNGSFVDTAYQLPFFIEDLPAGTYELSVSGSGCTYSENLLLENQLIPVAEIEVADTLVLEGSQVDLLINTNLDPIAVIWEPSDLTDCTDCEEISIVPTDGQTVWVSVVDQFGCSATAEVSFSTFTEIVFYLPNAFSPNEDGINDTFKPYFPPDFRGSVIDFQIYNRWGDRVFYRSNLSADDELLEWDGRFNGDLLNPGIFIYYIEVADESGETDFRSGEVQLVR